jgi:hypothetical protein
MGNSNIFLFTIITILGFAVAGISSPAYADSVTWTGSGDGTSWEDPNNWNPLGVPDQNDDITLTGGQPIISSDVTIGEEGSLTLASGTDLRIQGGTMTNKGTIDFPTPGQPDILLQNGATFINDCTGFIDFQVTGMIWVDFFSTTATLINHGNMIGDLPGAPGTFNNHIVLQSGGLIQNSGTLASVSEEGGTIEEIPADCDEGGPIFLTCEDPDFHAVDHVGSRGLFAKGINFITDPTHNAFTSQVDKFLFVNSNIQPPGGHRDGINGLIASGFVEGVDLTL